MKKASFARVDERLIHGQVMTAWVKKYWIKKIILVDDEIVQDSFMQEVLSMDAAAELSEDTSEDNIMLLFKELKYAGLLVNYGYPLEELDIGNIGSAPGRKAITKEVYISDAEKDIVRGLHEKNINVYIQKLPQDAQVDIMKKI